jgi:prevent-host-death family protein
MTRKRLTVTASRFQAECSALLEEVGRGLTEVVVTRRGKPVAKLVPIEQQRSAKNMAHVVGDLLAPLERQSTPVRRKRLRVTIHGDVVGPSEPGASW